jgi:hypothetical protein
LFLISVLMMVLGPILVSIANQLLDDRFQTEWVSPTPEQSTLEKPECIPEIDTVALLALDQLVVTHDDIVISLKMASLIFADQAVRQLPVNIDPQQVSEKDTLHRVKVLDYIKNGEIHSGRNLIYAAFIFQHGDCSVHYQFANRLAQIAMDAGYSDARWIYAASLDRYLMSIGKLQKFGTQYTWIEGEFKLYPVDPTTTDEERAKYNVPPLSNATTQKSEGTVSVSRKKWLETWWLTLIGSSFAALGAAIGVVDAKSNALHGWIVLLIAFLLYPISCIGHYAQIKALSQGVVETQGHNWLIVNCLAIVVWFVFVVFEGVRVSRESSAQPRVNRTRLRLW